MPSLFGSHEGATIKKKESSAKKNEQLQIDGFHLIWLD
jgi:hypothetical protein